MKRNLHSTDFLTLIGMMASIAGIILCLFFLFTPVTLGATGANVMTERSPDLQMSMRWLQPVLGQAIVEDALNRQRANDGANAAPFNERAFFKPAPGSVQWILGRVIVELNQTRMVGGLPDGGRQRNDQRIVRIVRHAAEQLQQGVLSGEDRTERLTGNVGLMF